MGRSYWFECSKCGYRAKVSGQPDRGLDLFVETVRCRECKTLYDTVTRIRFSEIEAGSLARFDGWRNFSLRLQQRAPATPPSFQAALNRLRVRGAKRFRWVNFPLQCPVSLNHRVEPWNQPGRCPCCGSYLEKSALPYRIWD